MKENETKTQNKGSKVLKTIINVVVNFMIVVVLITSLLIAVMALTSKANGISTIFGYTIQTIQSDSMKGGSPDGYGGKDFEKGDLMIAKATDFDPKLQFNVGDIVTYKSESTDGTEMLIVHRITDVVKDETGAYRYQTWGDNREMDPDPDQTDLQFYLMSFQIASYYYTDNFEGTIIKGFGGFLDYLRSQQGFFLIVLLPMIIFFIYELIRVILNYNNYNRAKAEEAKQEAVERALADKESDLIKTQNLTPEQMEQFKAFLEQQKQNQNQDQDQDQTET